MLTVTLKIDSFFDTGFPKEMMAPAHALFKAE